jgi:hypothetical protein
MADRSRPMTNVELVDALCAVSTPLSEARRVHMGAHGCLIPHVFMGDVLHRIGECLGARNAPDASMHRREVEGILAALEQGMSAGGRETRNVIALSFTRDSELEAFFEELRPLMGPSTRAQLAGR